MATVNLHFSGLCHALKQEARLRPGSALLCSPSSVIGAGPRTLSAHGISSPLVFLGSQRDIAAILKLFCIYQVSDVFCGSLNLVA